MSGSRLRPYLGPVIAMLVVLALGAGTVYAAIPNGNGKYYACYVKNTGAVRLINYPKVSTCKSGEKLINWSAQGPQGPQGPAGPVGPAGPADWNAIGNKPAGFADGVDNDGVTAVKISYASSSASTAGMALGANIQVTATCDSGKVVGGGAGQNGYGFQVLDSKPAQPNAWIVWYERDGSTDEGMSSLVFAHAICLTTTPSTSLASKGKIKVAAKSHR
jgi:hypothetical protein